MKCGVRVANLIIISFLCMFYVTLNAFSQEHTINNTNPPDPWQDTYLGVNYSVTSYDWVVVTIEFPLDKPLPETREINARDKRPEIQNDSLKSDIEALLDLGANYIDIGYNTDRLAAEIPFAHVDIDKNFAEKVLKHLINIRDTILSEAH